MAIASAPLTQTAKVSRKQLAAQDPAVVRWGLTALALGSLGLFIVLPLAAVFVQAFSKGVGVYLAAVSEPDTLSAIKLSLLAAGIAVPLNLIFGVAAAWAVTKFQFRGRSVLTSLIDIPFAVSPVVSGLIFVLVFGAQDGLAAGFRRTTSASSSPCRASSWRRCS